MIEQIVGFFARKPTADMLFFNIGGMWSAPWTTPAHNANGAHRTAEQYIRMGADGLRFCEELRLQFGDTFHEAVSITDLPHMNQKIIMIEDRSERVVAKLITTPTLDALISALAAATGSDDMRCDNGTE